MGSVIVALAILALIASVGIVAIVKYETVEEALKIWGVLSGLMGVVTGAFVTYFFTHPQIEEAEARVAAAEVKAVEAQVATQLASAEYKTLVKDASTLKTKFIGLADDAKWATVKADPEFATAVATFSAGVPSVFEAAGDLVTCKEIEGQYVCSGSVSK